MCQKFTIPYYNFNFPYDHFINFSSRNCLVRAVLEVEMSKNFSFLEFLNFIIVNTLYLKRFFERHVSKVYNTLL